MKLTQSIALLISSCLLSAVPAALSAPVQNEAAKFRVVRVTVLGLDGKPAAGRSVYLAGLSRGSMGPDDDNAKADGWWSFTTDAKGRFTARLAEFDTWSDKQQRPGWGKYALVVERSGHDAGAVSRKFINSKIAPENISDYQDEWGTPEILTTAGLDLILQIQAGIRLRGRVIDYSNPEHPLAGLPVTLCNDLHADTHTGYGAEIFDQSATTDADGRFTFSHIYPAEFHVALGQDPASRTPSAEGTIWLKTKLGDKWRDDALNSLTPTPEKSEMKIEIMATDKALFRYHGKVTDAAGRPVAGAKVWLGVSFDSEGGSYRDNHTFRNATTKRDGVYDMLLPTPWVNGIGARKEGFIDAEQWTSDDTASIRPGEYNIRMSPAKP
jgi:hypothetical protein